MAYDPRSKIGMLSEALILEAIRGGEGCQKEGKNKWK